MNSITELNLVDIKDRIVEVPQRGALVAGYGTDIEYSVATYDQTVRLQIDGWLNLADVKALRKVLKRLEAAAAL